MGWGITKYLKDGIHKGSSLHKKSSGSAKASHFQKQQQPLK